MSGSGMTPCHWDAAGGPFARFTPPVGHGAPRTRTVTVAPVGVALAEGSPFSERMVRFQAGASQRICDRILKSTGSSGNLCWLSLLVIFAGLWLTLTFGEKLATGLVDGERMGCGAVDALVNVDEFSIEVITHPCFFA